MIYSRKKNRLRRKLKKALPELLHLWGLSNVRKLLQRSQRQQNSRPRNFRPLYRKSRRKQPEIDWKYNYPNVALTGDKLVGFENHGGRTYLDKSMQPFGQVIKGFGNNGEDQTEGAIYKNSIGTYLHGPLLPEKSPTGGPFN